MLNKFFQGTKKKEAISWALYDFANSSYALLILTFVFPIYFKEVIAGSAYGDFYWGLIGSIAILTAGLVAPVVGAIADYDAHRKRKFVLFAFLAILGTASLYFTGQNKLLLAAILFISTHFFFELALVIYDSFLIHVATPKATGRISGLGYGLGYIGGLIAMFIFRPFYGGGYEGDLDNLYRLTFPLTALFFLIFAIPAFTFIKDEATKRKESLINLAKIGFKNTFSTIKSFKKYKNVGWFLLASYFLNDALVTLFSFISIYAKQTLSISISELAIIFTIIQLIAFPSTIFFGWLSDKKGSKKILLTTIVMWCFIVIALATAKTKALFYPTAILTGFIIGSNQAIARSWLGKIVPKEKRCEFFGFNGFASKISATIGPLVFGSISSFTGNQRWAMLALLPFFVMSFIIFLKVKER